MKRVFLSLIFVSGFFALSYAQQLHFMSQFMLHNTLNNPAAAGFADKNSVGISYRSMWEAFTGNPRTFMVYGDTKWEKKSTGIAGYVYKDQTGPTSRTGVQLALSYHVKTGENSRLGLGFEIRGLQYSIDKAKLSGVLGADPVLNGSNNKFKMDGGAGAYWSNEKLSIGAAVSQIIQSKLGFGNVANPTLSAQLYRHYFFSANYIIPTGDETRLIPNFQAIVVPNAPSEYILGFMLDYKDKIWWAMNDHINQSWSLQCGFKLFDNLRFTYAYDLYSSPFSDYNTGNNANEMGLKYTFSRKK